MFKFLLSVITEVKGISWVREFRDARFENDADGNVCVKDIVKGDNFLQNIQLFSQEILLLLYPTFFYFLSSFAGDLLHSSFLQIPSPSLWLDLVRSNVWRYVFHWLHYFSNLSVCRARAKRHSSLWSSNC